MELENSSDRSNLHFKTLSLEHDFVTQIASVERASCSVLLPRNDVHVKPLSKSETETLARLQ